MFKATREKESWDLRSFPVTQDFCDDLNQVKYPTPIGNKSGSANVSKGSCMNTTSSIFDTNDEHHISFSKNGKEIMDFDNDYLDGSKAALSVNISANCSDYLTVPSLFNDHLFDIYNYGGESFSEDGNAIKTRRSNSLTTPTASGDFTTSASAENLANLQKPRSFSLSMESSRNALVSSGSDTRLDEYSKMSQLRYNTNSHPIGMGHIGIWLKSLRLHKYFWLFSNMSYEQMLEMSEEYLENLGVTKGARHKLVICIQKLSERVPLLKQVERELVEGTRPLKNGLEEVTNIILTPMKPINSVPNDEDVATHVMRVLDCGKFLKPDRNFTISISVFAAFQIVLSIKYLSSADEESANVFLWVIDKALHHEAFMQQTTHLKELKYKMQRVKMTFTHKMHFGVGKSGSHTNKMR